MNSGRSQHSILQKRLLPGRIGLALFFLLALIPIVFSIGYALAYSLGLTGLLSEGFTWRHWQALFDSSEVWASFGLSLYVAAIVVLATLILSLAIALSVRQSLNRGPLSYAIYLPLAIPATVAAFIAFQVLSGGGYVSRLFMQWGFIEFIVQFPDLVNDGAAVAIIVSHVGLALPFFVILFHEIYASERLDDLVRLAQTMGASKVQVLRRVVLPILLHRGTMHIALLFIVVLGSYEIPLLLGQQAPQMVSVMTMRKYEMFDIAQKPEAFIAALLYTFVVLGMLAYIFRSRQNRMTF